MKRAFAHSSFAVVAGNSAWARKTTTRERRCTPGARGE